MVEQVATSTEMVRAEKLVKRFGNLTVLNEVDLSVKRGQVVVVIGPSGSGKTTMLRCLNHLEKIDDGRIYIDGELLGYRDIKGKLVEDREATIARMRAQIGFVFQRFNLFAHKTGLENIIEAPIHVLHQSKAEVRDRAMGLLAKVGLVDKAHTYPHKLSGGQQQRVAIARAQSPRVAADHQRAYADRCALYPPVQPWPVSPSHDPSPPLWTDEAHGSEPQ